MGRQKSQCVCLWQGVWLMWMSSSFKVGRRPSHCHKSYVNPSCCMATICFNLSRYTEPMFTSSIINVYASQIWWNLSPWTWRWSAGGFWPHQIPLRLMWLDVSFSDWLRCCRLSSPVWSYSAYSASWTIGPWLVKIHQLTDLFGVFNGIGFTLAKDRSGVKSLYSWTVLGGLEITCAFWSSSEKIIVAQSVPEFTAHLKRCRTNNLWKWQWTAARHEKQVLGSWNQNSLIW